MNERFTDIKTWLNSLGYSNYSLTIASEDASFRRYLRISQGENSYIIMDAPPEKEPCDAFVAVAKKLRSAGLSAPEIIHENHDEGFLLLTDFGDESYLQALNEDSAPVLYDAAINAINRMQSGIDADDLPPYDEALLRREMNLFHDWFLGELLDIELSLEQEIEWKTTTDTLVANALAQPQVFVHRDYHSRNLMRLRQDNPGIIDFQDAVKGPVTYDLVSLLRDCYIDWPQEQVSHWVQDFFQLSQPGALKGVEADVFIHWFNLMGVQRHLKAVGIFSRLKIRDGKGKFLRDIPRTLGYIHSIAGVEESLASLQDLVNDLDLAQRIESVLSRDA